MDIPSAQPEGMTTATQVPTTIPVQTYSLTDTIDSPHDITMAVNLHLQGALEQLQWASSAASTLVFQGSTPRREPPSAALGAPPSTEGTEDPLGQKETDLAIPALMATLTHTLHRWPHQVTPPASPTPLTNCCN